MSRALRLRHRLIGLRAGSSRRRYNTAGGGRRQQGTSRDIIHDAYPFMISDRRDAPNHSAAVAEGFLLACKPSRKPETVMFLRPPKSRRDTAAQAPHSARFRSSIRCEICSSNQGTKKRQNSNLSGVTDSGRSISRRIFTLARWTGTAMMPVNHG
jgi:hypothetical protein